MNANIITPVDNVNAQPRPIKLAKNDEFFGVLQGFEEVARGILQVQIGKYAILLPMSLGPQLKELLGQRIGVSLIERHGIQKLPEITQVPQIFTEGSDV